ncbi:MAG: lasso RiPP family leader peptide-containing protein [Actinomyces sp.]|nr:lasso RiPP family leader peptide-containing protein [Actinomyces sp.]MDN5985058.1 lasso RiPP family leader peptide-containing protein [Propionibacterium sp.]MDN6566438.1 lasso RiPP family leader peptide-containing protein [Actinomyces sp.]MDN6793657.1 lasso RiPP family leader peptide-containing protein [Propionibacterium sp.]
MFTTYETPVIELVGDFRHDTGEFIGPYDEQILPLEDHSK